MTELLPCPFCGGEARTMEQHGWWVFCPECMCDLGFEGMDESGCYGHFDTEAEAVEAWNTRHEDTCRRHDGFCSECGMFHVDGINFCPYCGRRVEQ